MLSTNRLIGFLLIFTLALALPAASLAQSGGNDEYEDPFKNEDDGGSGGGGGGGNSGSGNSGGGNSGPGRPASGSGSGVAGTTAQTDGSGSDDSGSLPLTGLPLRRDGPRGHRDDRRRLHAQAACLSANPGPRR